MPPKADVLQAWVPTRLEASPEATSDELAVALARKHDVAVSAAAVSRAIAALGWTRKKRA